VSAQHQPASRTAPARLGDHPRRQPDPAPSLASRNRVRPGSARLSGQILVFILSRVLGLAVLLGTSGLLYHVASSPDFRVSRVSVDGNRLLTTAELEAVASVSGVNVFWVRRSELSQRLRLLPPVESADVSLELPDRVQIRVKERDPAAIWLVGDTPFLVDRQGLVLATRPAERPLIVIRDTSNRPLTPGARVSAEAIGNLADIDSLLARIFGPQQRRYEYSPETGINVVQTVGPRLILGNGVDLEWKMAAIQTITRHLQASRASAELIDVRFSDRPYFR
jgi:hypothetical protein